MTFLATPALAVIGAFVGPWLVVGWRAGLGAALGTLGSGAAGALGGTVVGFTVGAIGGAVVAADSGAFSDGQDPALGTCLAPLCGIAFASVIGVIGSCIGCWAGGAAGGIIGAVAGPTARTAWHMVEQAPAPRRLTHAAVDDRRRAMAY